MKNKLIIIGASGHGKVVADVAMKMEKWQKIAFLDDNEAIKTCLDLDVIGKTTDAFKYKGKADFFVAIGNNAVRKREQERLLSEGFSIVSLIHPAAVIGSGVKIDIGTVVMANVVINSASSIGKGCIINTSSSVDHDNTIKDYVHISPGVHLAGTVTLGEESWIGVGSTVSNNVNIGKCCIIGAGSVVIKDLSAHCIAVGIPAKPIKVYE